MTHERDILHERGGHYVALNRRCSAFTVFRHNGTHAISDSAYCHTASGLSLAMARVDYLAKRDAAKVQP